MIILTFLPLLAALVLCGFVVIDLVMKRFTFWPPPHKGSWQNRSFIWLFRVIVYGLIVVTVHFLLTDLERVRTWPFGLGVALVVIGFAGGFAATFGLGWKNAFGSKEGLRTDGIFRYSRNPIYVATWVGLAGWAIAAPAPAIVGALIFWAAGYLGAIFLEEDWLRKQYGTEFDVYCQNVPRFFGVRP